MWMHEEQIQPNELGPSGSNFRVKVQLSFVVLCQVCLSPNPMFSALTGPQLPRRAVPEFSLSPPVSVGTEVRRLAASRTRDRDETLALPLSVTSACGSTLCSACHRLKCSCVPGDLAVALATRLGSARGQGDTALPWCWHGAWPRAGAQGSTGRTNKRRARGVKGCTEGVG